jgi:hypothetical protein
MYNRVLNRPMFKRGGDVMDAQGTGITSGLDTPRQRYQFGEEVEKLSETIRVTPEQRRSNALDAITSGFLNPKARTVGEAVYHTNLARESGIEPLEARVAEQKFELSKMPLERTAAIDVTKAGVRQLDVHAKRAISDEADQLLLKARTDYAGKDIPQHIRDKFESLKLLALGNEFFTIAAATELAEKVYGTPQILDAWGVDDIKEAKADFIAMMTGRRFTAKATGGRVGYQLGVGPNVMEEKLQENIKTPGGDVAISEKIDQTTVPVSEAQGSGLGENSQSYELLRARLPQEITNDIVMLIAYNPQAFEDFAAIETQQDVMAFNKKYQVELVIPAQEV